MSNITENFYFELPKGTLKVEDVLFNLPQQYTGGLYINIWLTGLFGILFMGGLTYGQGGIKSSLFAGFGTFIVTFILTLGGWAGGNQLIPAPVGFIAVTAYVIMEGRVK